MGKKLDHLQDGARGNITKDEVDALTRKIASLNSESPTLGSEKSKGIPIDSKITKDTNAPKHTHESRSFTGLAIGSEEYKGLDAGKKMSEIFKRKI